MFGLQDSMGFKINFSLKKMCTYHLEYWINSPPDISDDQRSSEPKLMPTEGFRVYSAFYFKYVGHFSAFFA